MASAPPASRPASRPPSRFPTPLTLVLLLIISCGIAAVWALVSLYTGKQSTWMAVVAAFDAVWVLRACRMRAGWGRAASAVLGTIVAVAFANWSIAATRMGLPLGIPPWDSFVRLGSDHAWTLISLTNSALDVAWIGAALVVAAVAGR